MAGEPRIAIVGPGNLGTTLAIALHRAGYKIDEIVTRQQTSSRVRGVHLARRVRARYCDVNHATLAADVVWLCVPDREIRNCAQSLIARSNWKTKVVLHSSGALSSDELKIFRRKGAAVASLHPFMTFVSRAVPSLKAVPFAVEGDARAVRVARRITRDLGAEVFTIAKENKPAYHAWGSFASPLLIALLVTAEQVAAAAGVPATEARRRMLPILRQTVANYAEVGGPAAFSGPIIRGDVATLRKHLKVLRKLPRARATYLALARSALHNLPIGERRQLTRLLDEL
jgi:predicted short-subunit dehydrogenase-like oxidoreductase (DUF2520 family)